MPRDQPAHVLGPYPDDLISLSSGQRGVGSGNLLGCDNCHVITPARSLSMVSGKSIRYRLVAVSSIEKRIDRVLIADVDLDPVYSTIANVIVGTVKRVQIQDNGIAAGAGGGKFASNTMKLAHRAFLETVEACRRILGRI